jgi:hypothetical protein
VRYGCRSFLPSSKFSLRHCKHYRSPQRYTTFRSTHKSLLFRALAYLYRPSSGPNPDRNDEDIRHINVVMRSPVHCGVDQIRTEKRPVLPLAVDLLGTSSRSLVRLEFGDMQRDMHPCNISLSGWILISKCSSRCFHYPQLQTVL